MKLGNLWTTPLWLQAPNESQAPAHFFPEEMCCNGSEVLSDEKKICTKP